MSNKNRISMKQVNRQNQYAEFSMTISTSRELWRYLFRGQKNSSEKLTRVEAFHDLIERQYAALQQENECIFGSISSLSRSWHWDRDTTSAFIADLEKFGAVSRYDIGNCHNNESITEAFSASLKANTFSNRQKYSKY